jgi:uncharacterized membrane protein (DUF4010 family)
MPEWPHWTFRLAIAAGLGLLVGLQRQHAATRLAGVRTFPLIALFGFLTATLAQSANAPWTLAAAFLALGALLIFGGWLAHRGDQNDFGVTTEIAALVIFTASLLCAYGHTGLAVVAGASTAVLLQFKAPMHRWIARLSDDDMRAAMQFALISLVVLPILPNRTFGPFDVLNPRQVWWMVVLIVGIDLGGYIAYQGLGARGGAWAAGLLGGLISSTATTASYSRGVRAGSHPLRLAEMVLTLASGVVFVRILGEVLALAPELFWHRAWRMLAAPLVLVAYAVWRWRNAASQQVPAAPASNPTALAPALWFGLLYAVVLWAAAAAQATLGAQGLFGVAALAGLTDVDAITLSTSRLAATGRLDATLGAHIILTAAVSNLVFKIALAWTLGGRALAQSLLLPFACTALVAWAVL